MSPGTFWILKPDDQLAANPLRLPFWLAEVKKVCEKDGEMGAHVKWYVPASRPPWITAEEWGKTNLKKGDTGEVKERTEDVLRSFLTTCSYEVEAGQRNKISDLDFQPFEDRVGGAWQGLTKLTQNRTLSSTKKYILWVEYMIRHYSENGEDN